jgi:divalent metal cation (Fe/Co/Zn/Cd) transporter
MSMHLIGIAVLLFVLSLISGLADAQGFVHAANIWQGGKLVWPEVIKSALGFGGGIIAYWICIRFLQDFRIVSPEIQTLGWFTATIIGVALFSGKFLHWHIVDQLVGIVVLCGVAWLLFRTGG